MTDHNRSLRFDVEMVRYCGRTTRLRGRADRVIGQHTGKLINIGSDRIVLERVVCTADHHRLCTRNAFPFGRVVWLEKIE